MEEITGVLDGLNLSGIDGANSASLDDSRDSIARDDDESSVLALNTSENIVKPLNAYSPWVKSFNVTYQSTKKYKNVLVEGDDIHFKLRCLENHERESRDYSGTIPNYVVANIGFVISDRVHEGKEGHHGRRFVSFPVKFGNQTFTQVNDTYTFDEKADDGKTPRSREFKEDLIAESSADKKSAIERDYKSSGPNFVQSYHHSERALWKSLKKSGALDSIFAELEKVLDKDGKVYCMVLDLHSTRYMCSNCEPSSYIVQQKLKAKFEERFAGKYKTSEKGFFTFSRVSAEEKSKRSQKNDSDHREKCTETVQELRDKNLNVVFQRDDRSTKSYKKIMEAHGFFVSADTERLNSPRSFYVSQRMDANSSTVALTRQNSSFGTFAKEDAKKVGALLKQIDKLRKARKFEEARQCVEEALQIEPENPQVVCFYSIVLIDTHRFMEALPFAVKAYGLYFKIQQDNPNEVNQSNAGICLNNLNLARQGILNSINALIESGRLDAGLDLVQNAIQVNDGYGEFHLCCVNILEKQGEIETALELLEAVKADGRFGEEVKQKAIEMGASINTKVLQAQGGSAFQMAKK